MLRSAYPSVLVLALSCASACDGPKPADTSPASSGENAAKPADKPTEKPAEKPASTEAGPAETLATDARPPAPAWFDAGKIEHEAIINQIASKEAVATGFASALILELAPGTTNEQCIATASKTLAESIPSLAEPVASGDRMMLQGKTDGYDYMVVCGQAKGKPTLYLSYTTK